MTRNQTVNKNTWLHQLSTIENILKLLPLSDAEKNHSQETINAIIVDIAHYNHLRQIPIINARIASLTRKLIPLDRFSTARGITPPEGSGFSCQHYVRSKYETPSHPSIPTTRPRLISS